MAIRLTVQMQVHPDKTEEFEAIVQTAAKRVRTEDKGCEMYHLFRGVDDDGSYVLLEAWATKEDMKAHTASAGTREMVKVGPLLAGRPVAHRYEG